MGPPVAGADRKSRSAIAADTNAAGIFEDLLAAANIITKFVRALAIGPAVIEPVACQLVPFRNNASRQVRVTYRYPAQDEEGGPGASFAEDVEQAFGIALDAARQGFPTAAIDRRCEGLDLKIILDINRQRIRHAAAHMPETGSGGRPILSPLLGKMLRRAFLDRIAHDRSV